MVDHFNYKHDTLSEYPKVYLGVKYSKIAINRKRKKSPFSYQLKGFSFYREFDLSALKGNKYE